VKEGVSPNRLKAIGHGETFATAENGTDEDHAANRKVLFILR